MFDDDQAAAAGDDVAVGQRHVANCSASGGELDRELIVAAAAGAVGLKSEKIADDPRAGDRRRARGAAIVAADDDATAKGRCNGESLDGDVVGANRQCRRVGAEVAAVEPESQHRVAEICGGVDGRAGLTVTIDGHATGDGRQRTQEDVDGNLRPRQRCDIEIDGVA